MIRKSPKYEETLLKMKFILCTELNLSTVCDCFIQNVSPSQLPCFNFFQEEQNRGKPNWEHLNEDLHVLITVEDAQNRAEIKLKRAVEEVKKLLIPAVSIYMQAFDFHFQKVLLKYS